MFYKKVKDDVQCQLCPHFCLIHKYEYGKCKARKNTGGKLCAMTYAKPVSIAIDPIEKKPLFHFGPGSDAYSVGFTGCNLGCKFCLNHEASQAFPEDIKGRDFSPEYLVSDALTNDCKVIAYTYNEPTISFEYVYETAMLAREKGLKNIMVTNGFINKEPLEKLYKYIDAANVDFKSFDEKFYENVCMARLKPVLETLKSLHKMGVWIEMTNLVIPGLNDDFTMIKKMCNWIKTNLGTDYPLHFTRFHPYYKMMGNPITPYETLKKAHDIALKAGLKYVYLGNVPEEEYNHTYCPDCKELLIKRSNYFEIEANNIKEGVCSKCKSDIKGVWEVL